MYMTINGWTKERMKAAIMAGNNGRVARATGNDGTVSPCIYLAPDGNKCAVGCFIPDGHPGQKLWGSSYQLLWAHPDLATAMPLGYDGLAEMQEIHDEADQRIWDHQKQTYVTRAVDIDPRPLILAWINTNVVDA